ncbi:hypothetical protein Rs2_39902 [Raphanus sativus]|uniref:Uncharacterized protein LOC108826597 n=1 Tax=Raphanus sativus TaxID=3726 RepID=A0A9W3CIW4_RAPSA|nr:uncharacterized protein LOC108826597 [Raphanus sativus]KAJ4874884.1 hypothetical protein Rs2_39902 [Raphanus sativus]
MSFACLVCHSVESPSHSLRSYSVSSSDNEGRCSVIASCLSRTSLIQAARSNTFPASSSSSSKVTPQPNSLGGDLMTTEGASPRLVRSRAVRRDIVRDWNFNETETEL